MKFKFGDRVKVIGGFYQDSFGYVTDYSSVDNQYYFDGYKKGSGFIRTWIDADYLEKTEE